MSEHHYRLQIKILIQRGWRKQEPNPFRGEEQSSRMLKLLYRGIVEEIISLSKAANLLGTTPQEFRKITNQYFQNQ